MKLEKVITNNFINLGNSEKSFADKLNVIPERNFELSILSKMQYAVEWCLINFFKEINEVPLSNSSINILNEGKETTTDASVEFSDNCNSGYLVKKSVKYKKVDDTVVIVSESKEVCVKNGNNYVQLDCTNDKVKNLIDGCINSMLVVKYPGAYLRPNESISNFINSRYKSDDIEQKCFIKKVAELSNKYFKQLCTKNKIKIAYSSDRNEIVLVDKDNKEYWGGADDYRILDLSALLTLQELDNDICILLSNSLVGYDGREKNTLAVIKENIHSQWLVDCWQQ